MTAELKEKREVPQYVVLSDEDMAREISQCNKETSERNARYNERYPNES